MLHEHWLSEADEEADDDHVPNLHLNTRIEENDHVEPNQVDNPSQNKFKDSPDLGISLLNLGQDEPPQHRPFQKALEHHWNWVRDDCGQEGDNPHSQNVRRPLLPSHSAFKNNQYFFVVKVKKAGDPEFRTSSL